MPRMRARVGGLRGHGCAQRAMGRARIAMPLVQNFYARAAVVGPASFSLALVGLL